MRATETVFTTIDRMGFPRLKKDGQNWEGIGLLISVGSLVVFSYPYMLFSQPSTKLQPLVKVSANLVHSIQSLSPIFTDSKTSKIRPYAVGVAS